MSLKPISKAIQKKKPLKEKIGRVNIPSDFHLITEYHGYRNKEDITNLPEGYLVYPSQNVLVTTGGRIGIRQGYTLDGQADATLAGVISSFDWTDAFSGERNLRYCNGKLQYRYVASVGDKWNTNTFTAGQVFWIDLMTSLTATNINFVSYWDTAQLLTECLFVMGDSNIYEWSGGITTLSAGATGTLTKNGSSTWGEEGFLISGTRNVIINGTVYNYTGGENTTILTGVTPDPTAEPANSVVHQQVRTHANSASTANSLPSAFQNDLIGIFQNYVFIGSFTNRAVYMSKQNSFVDYQKSTPRLTGEGAIFGPFDGLPTALTPQEDGMYISAGTDYWYKITFTDASLALSNATTITVSEPTITPLKISPRQAARSQALAAKYKNDVLYVNFETTFDSLGRVSNNLATPQQTNLSDPIRNDFDTYDFTDGHVIYFRNYLYISVPKNGRVLIYNIIKNWWESPQILPVGRFSIIGGVLYGHDYNVPQTYQLFTGYNDNGNPIDTKALFSYENFGSRVELKDFNEYYVEGYISSNSTITCGVNYETDGNLMAISDDFLGTDSLVASFGAVAASLGKSALGKNPIGGLNTLTGDIGVLPPKFRVIFTHDRHSFHEIQSYFSSIGIDYQWEILAFGPLVRKSEYQDVKIKK